MRKKLTKAFHDFRSYTRPEPTHTLASTGSILYASCSIQQACPLPYTSASIGASNCTQNKYTIMLILTLTLTCALLEAYKIDIPALIFNVHSACYVIDKAGHVSMSLSHTHSLSYSRRPLNNNVILNPVATHAEHVWKHKTMLINTTVA